MGCEVKKLLFATAIALLITGCDQSPEQQEKNDKRDAIKLCWKDYDRKSVDEATKRFIAGACEKMESDFKERYHVSP